MEVKTQRVRDPLHDIISFDGQQFEHSLWDVIQTRPFQRLRRIKQLGFSELTYPGATHTRFAHSIGVFHTARQLMRVIERHVQKSNLQWGESESKVAIAAALVHDVGHGMFSHAFEAVSERLNLGALRHEDVSKLLIQDSEITDCLKKNGGGFANDVATLIGRNGPATLYDAVVSSQFDADRLDYMRRDRLMAGVQSAGIDFPWLIDNLEVGAVRTGTDDAPGEWIETFVLGPKSMMAAEGYVLALFQLYPTVYFHKATRAAEKVFCELMVRILRTVRDTGVGRTGLPKTHPLVKFAKSPGKLESVLALDDTVFWGALDMLAAAKDDSIASLARRIRDRKLPKSIDLRPEIEAALPSPESDDGARSQRNKLLKRWSTEIEQRLDAWNLERPDDEPRAFLDKAKRDPYSRGDEKGPFNRIRIKDQNGEISDISDHSPMIASLQPFEALRAYCYPGDTEARDKIYSIAREVISGE